ncbi:Scw4 protein [Candida orthopsilosis Co 90-125]|uniref:Scw4 protein n=1 Tax=Candida orthopsilosis (strain 90-125) TaxID=1136231 RepID=H8X1S5_CANO9|nr:Scw4 protein [Candida orthopsilosis Co 90-125]CCG22480.1 Scw4 protein [Candida orthopsilosis Co 90-125]
MKLRLVAVALAAASITEAAPIKRSFLDDLLGLDDTTTTSALTGVQAAAATTSIPVVAGTPAASAATTSSTGGFWANLFDGFGRSSATTTAAQVAAQATTQAIAQAAATTASTPTTSSGGFFADLFDDFFGSRSTTQVATTTAAAAAAATTAAPSAQTPTSVAAIQPTTTTSPSTSSGNSVEDLFAFLLGRSSSAPTATSASQSIPSSGNSASGSGGGLFGNNGESSSSAYGASSQALASSVVTNTYQGGSPGKYTGSINTATATASNGGSSAGATAAAGSKGITYSPYTKDDQCKTASEVADDIAKLSSYELIRLYSTDCSGIENVLAAMGSSQKLYLGLWNIDTSSVQSGLSEIKSAISTSSRGWSSVHTIAVGNERVNSGEATVSQMQDAVDTARQWLKSNAADYTGYVVTVDTLVAYVANPQLCEMSDYFAVNSHPYWDGGVDPSDSGPWLEQQISNLQSVCGTSKDVLITETGWPTQGDAYGSCVPSVANQVAAVKSIKSSLGSKVIMFTMYNDYWKDPGAYNVEQHWGLYGDPSE